MCFVLINISIILSCAVLQLLHFSLHNLEEMLRELSDSRATTRNSIWVTPSGGVKCRWSRLKSATFDKQLAICRKRYKIAAQFLLKLNRKSHALYRMVALPMALSAS